MILQVSILLAQVISADDVVIQQQGLVDFGDWCRTLDDELVEEGTIIPYFVAFQLADLVCGVMRFLVTQIRRLAQAMSAHDAHIDAGRQRHQALVGANVAGRFLAPDILLARLEREHVTAFAFFIHRLAHNAARDATHIFARGAEETQVGTAKAKRHTQRLTFAGHDVRAIFRRRFEQPERDRVRRNGQQSAFGVDLLGQAGHILKLAKEVRITEHEAGGFIVHQL